MKPWLRYFIPRKRWQGVPRVLIETLSTRGAQPEERALIKSGRARNIQHARELMSYYGATTAEEVLKQLPPLRRGKTLEEKLRTLLFRIVGHDDSDPYKRKEDNRIPVKHKYKD